MRYESHSKRILDLHGAVRRLHCSLLVAVMTTRLDEIERNARGFTGPALRDDILALVAVARAAAALRAEYKKAWPNRAPYHAMVAALAPLLAESGDAP
jgi:ribosomal protein S28E/S33